MSESAARFEDAPSSSAASWFASNGTTLGRDTMAGVTTFIVMSYIIFVNPADPQLRGHRGAPARSGSPSTGCSRRRASSPA